MRGSASRSRRWSEPDRDPDMAARKSQPLVEALRVDAGMMREKLDQLAAPRARLVDRPLHEFFADAAAAAVGSDAHVLDQPARSALRAQSGQDAELQAADNPVALLGHHELDVRLAP